VITQALYLRLRGFIPFLRPENVGVELRRFMRPFILVIH